MIRILWSGSCLCQENTDHAKSVIIFLRSGERSPLQVKAHTADHLTKLVSQTDIGRFDSDRAGCAPAAWRQSESALFFYFCTGREVSHEEDFLHTGFDPYGRDDPAGTRKDRSGIELSADHPFHILPADGMGRPGTDRECR